MKSAHKDDRRRVLQEGLRAAKLPDVFQLPLSQRFEARGIRYDECRVMDSKKVGQRSQREGAA